MIYSLTVRISPKNGDQAAYCLYTLPVIIRRAQFEAFEQASVDKFVKQILFHLSEFAPAHKLALGEAATAEIVRLGIRRAERHGLSTEGPVRLYIEMMFLLGSDFDSDPQFPQLAQILALRDGEACRANLLYKWMNSYAEEVFGFNGERIREALERIITLSPDSLQELSSRTVAESSRLDWLRWLYPEKYSFIGLRPLMMLDERSKLKAAETMSGSKSGLVTMIGLMFFLGHHVLEDPLYPWIRPTASGNSEERAADLFSRAKAYAMAAIAGRSR